jgi:hypothetical protein
MSHSEFGGSGRLPQGFRRLFAAMRRKPISRRFRRDRESKANGDQITFNQKLEEQISMQVD